MSKCHGCYYPQYSVLYNEEARRLPIHGAAQVVAEGGTLLSDALECDGTTRPISDTEKQQVMEAATQWQLS